MTKNVDLESILRLDHSIFKSWKEIERNDRYFFMNMIFFSFWLFAWSRIKFLGNQYVFRPARPAQPGLREQLYFLKLTYC